MAKGFLISSKDIGQSYYSVAVKAGSRSSAIKGFDDESSAKDDCQLRNEKAIKFGIETRYEVRGSALGITSP